MARSIISLIVLALAGAVFSLFTQPSYDQVQILNGQISQYNNALDKASELQKLKQTLLARYNAFNPDDVNRLMKLLPDHIDNVALILDLDNLASKYGMGLTNVDVTSSASRVNAAAAAIAVGGQKYDSQTLKFSTTGPYEDFKMFMSDLESSLRVVDLVSLSLTQGTGVDANGNFVSKPQFNYSVVLRTYWLK